MRLSRTRRATVRRLFIREYEANVVPLLREAGFTGAWDQLEKKIPIGTVSAFVERSVDTMVVGVALHDELGVTGRARSPLGLERFPLPRSLDALADRIRGLRATVTANWLPKIAELAATAAPDVSTVESALEYALRRLEVLLGLPSPELTAIELMEGHFRVHLAFAWRSGVAVARPSAIRSLLHAVYTDLVGVPRAVLRPTSRDVLAALATPASALVQTLAEIDPEEAAKLFVQLRAPFQAAPSLPASHPLAARFARWAPLAERFPCRVLSSVKTIRELIPLVREGEVLARLEALRHLDEHFPHAFWSRDFARVYSELEDTAAALLADAEPCLADAGDDLHRTLERYARTRSGVRA